MQSGSINSGKPKSHIKRQPQTGATDAPKSAAANAEGATAGAGKTQESGAPSDSSTDSLPLGIVVDVAPDALRTTDDGKGGYESAMTLAFVNKDDRARLEKEGAIFPEVKQAILGDGVGPEGRIEAVALHDTNNSETVNVARTHEVPKELLEVDPETGQPKLENFTPTLLAQGEGILGANSMSVPKGSVVIPEGFEATLGLSKEAQKVKSHRAVVNNVTKTLGSLSGSSLAGVMKLPLLTPLAPLLALGTLGFSVNQNLEAKQDAKAQLGYLDQQVKKSEGDLVEMKTANGESFHVSGKNERFRLETAVRQANLQLGSSAMLAVAGGTVLIGSLAGAGVAGFAGMAGAAAAAPFLAGGGLILGNGGMVFNSLAQLKDLSKEKAELEAAAAKGETHVDRVIEGMNPTLRRATSALDSMVSIPISERLKQVEKEQRKQRLLATAMSGGMISIGNMVLGIGAVGAVGVAAMAPAGALWAGQSISQLRELGKEKKELEAARAKGETMVERDLQQADLSWKTERVPISTLLAENKKSRNKHKMILTSVGSVGAALGMTLGAGMGIAAAAPLAIVPLAIGAALFPDKVKEFATKVKGLVSGWFGESGKTRRSAEKATGKLADDFTTRLNEKLADLKEAQPGLFTERPSKGLNPLKALKTEYGGYYHEMGRLAKEYAGADSAQERQQYMKHIGDAIKNAPDEAKPGLAVFQEELKALSLEVEAEWLARDIALEMKSPVTDKVLSDKRVESRVKELEFPTDTLREQFEESLYIENTPSKLEKLMVDSQAGDRDAARVLARTEVFKAGRILAMMERDLGVDLYTRYMDALQRPEDKDNLELLMKEVGYRQQVGVSAGEVELASGALRTLNTPLQLSETDSGPKRVALQGPEARMENAFRGLSSKQPELAKELGDAFALLNTPSALQGMDEAQAQQTKVAANMKLNKVRQQLEKKEPELLNLWDGARREVENTYFERSVDHEFKAKVLDQKSVKDASKELGISADEVEGLYMGLMKSQLLHDPRDLESRLADESGSAVDTAKAEMLDVIDKAMLRTAAEVTQGGADFVPSSEAPANPAEDPKVKAWLEQSPDVVGALNSEGFKQLAAGMNLPTEEVQQAYLTLAQADLNPALAAEFNGRLEAGEMQTVRTYQVGQAALQYIMQNVKPDPEAVAQGVEQSMSGPVVQTVLADPGIVELAKSLSVDPNKAMRLYLHAELGKDPSALAALEVAAKKGDTAAANQLQFLQRAIPAVQYVANQVQSGAIPVTQAGPDQAA